MKAAIFLFVVFTLAFARFDTEIEQVQDLMAKESYKEALEQIYKMEQKYKKNGLEKAYLLHTKAFVFYNQENYKEAKRYFYESLDLNALPQATKINTMIVLAQLELYTKDHQKALDLIRKVEKLDSSNANIYLIEAQIYIEKRDYNKAYTSLKKVVEKDPKISHYRTLATICVELEKYQEAINIYRKNILDKEREKVDFLNLFYIYLMIDDESSAVDMLTIAKAINILDSDGDIVYAKSLIRSGIPMRAARLIQKLLDDKKIERNVENLLLLATSLNYAKEHIKAVDIFLEIYEISKEQKYLENAIFILYDRLKYQKVVNLKDRYFSLKNKNSKVLFIFAISFFEIKQNSEALEILYELEKDKKYTKDAKLWIQYINNKMNRSI